MLKVTYENDIDLRIVAKRLAPKILKAILEEREKKEEEGEIDEN